MKRLRLSKQELKLSNPSEALADFIRYFPRSMWRESLSSTFLIERDEDEEAISVITEYYPNLIDLVKVSEGKWSFSYRGHRLLIETGEDGFETYAEVYYLHDKGGSNESGRNEESNGGGL